MCKGAWVPLNRLLARLLIPGLIRLQLSANAVTCLSLLVGLGSGVAFLKGRPPFFWWGALGFLAANILDECDGEVARRTGTVSGFGSWFDVLTDGLVHMAFFFGLGFGWMFYTSQSHWGILGALMALMVLGASILSVRREILLRGVQAWLHPDPPHEEQYRRAGWVDAIRGWFRIDFSILVLISAVVGWMGWILWAGLIGVLLFWIPTDLWISRVKVKQGRVTR